VKPLPLWKKLWLLFTIIWVVVSALNAGTILAFSEEHEKAWQPIVLGIAVPAALYVILWIWQRLRRRPPE
jgi:cyanate permease